MTAPPVQVGQEIQESLFKDRERTDFVPLDIWILIPIASYALWSLLALIPVLVGIAVFSQLTIPLAILEMVGLLVSAVTGYFVYTLVNRRNTHMAREQALFAQTLDSVKFRTRPDDLKTLFPLSSAEHNFAQLTQGSGERSAIFWGLLVVVPYVGWLALVCVLWFLSEDWKKHEVKEELMLQDLDRSLLAWHGEGIPRRERASNFPNSAALLVLTLFFLGVASFGLVSALFILGLTALGFSPSPSFSLESLLILLGGLVCFGIVSNYWLFRTIEDPLAHFRHHRTLEPALFKLDSSATH